MGCPADAIDQAIRRCPFLHQVSAEQGEQYARKIATRPAVPALSTRPQPVFEERSDDFEATLKLFHGPSGVVPLSRFGEAKAQPVQADLCQEETVDPCPNAASGRRRQSQIAAAPFAAMSMSGAFNFLPGPRDLSDFLFGKEGSKPRSQRQPSQRQGPSSGKGATSSKGPVSGQSAAAQHGGHCPLRNFPGAQIVGGLIPLSAKGKLQCPRAIMAGRAFVARLQPVRDLRPQALPVKLATLGAGTAMLNVPFGMWRDHTKKFSPEWFLAVHATIPFVAMTRQGIGMPKTVIFLTIAAAIAGQAVGARVERKRMAWLAAKNESEVKMAAAAARKAGMMCGPESVHELQQQDTFSSLACSFLHSRQPMIPVV